MTVSLGRLRERIAAPKVFVPAGLFADPVWRGVLDKFVRALRFAVWEDPSLGLVQDATRADYSTKLVFEKPPDAESRNTTLHFEFFDSDGRRVFRQEVTVKDIDDVESLRATFAEVLSGLSLRR